MDRVPTASQTVGPFFSIGLERNYHSEMTTDEAGAVRVQIRGRVLDGEAEPIPDAVLEFWLPGSEQSGERGVPNGFARVATDENGHFQVTVVKPSGTSRANGRAGVSHLSVLLFMRGLLRHLLTRVYFSGEETNGKDVVLQAVPESRRKTLIACAGDSGEFVWDIRMQGEEETVFFEA
jgi:protocatechuate 3,4-dioxygenase alpha subunit